MQYSQYTVNVTNNSATVVGNLTTFITSGIVAGHGFKITGDPTVYTIASVPTENSLVLSIPYQGDSVDNSRYIISVDYTPNVALAEVNPGDRDWPTILTQQTIRRMDTLFGNMLAALNMPAGVAYGKAWKDLLPTVVAAPGGSVAPNLVAIGDAGNIKAQKFPNENTTEEFNPSFQFPHEWVEGSTVEPHLHVYVPANGATPLVLKFKMVYVWDNVDSTGANALVPDTEHTLYGTYTVPANAGANPNAIVSFGNLAGTGKKISSIMSCHVTRDTNANGDTFNGAVWLKSADIHVECNIVGSATQFAK